MMIGVRPEPATAQITSPTNPRVKHLVALRRRRVREASGETLVDGYEELLLALDAGVRPRALYYCPPLVDERRLATVNRVAALGAEVVRLSRPAFEKVSYRESPDGWLAVVPAVVADLAALEPEPRPLLLVCEGVEKPGNLGAMLRTADAAGVAAVIAAGPVTDWGNPNLIRASKGTVFSVPVASAEAEDVLRWLAARGVALVATTPDTDTLFTDVDLTGPVAIAVGSEKHGLSARFLAVAHVRARIPMFGRADSLNVATSAAVATYEAVRQRAAAARTAG
jgi:TrmH family RNA methyltransferase